MKKRLIIGIVVCAVLVLAVAGLLIREYVMQKTVAPVSLARAGGVLACTLVFAVRYFGTKTPRDLSSLVRYPESYRKLVEHVFIAPDQKKERKQFFKAIELFNQEKYEVAAEQFRLLHEKSVTADDEIGTLFFGALCYTELREHETAAYLYSMITKLDDRNSRVWSNMGYQYAELGEHQNAIQCYEKSIACDPNNPYPYVNIAGEYIHLADFEAALPYAQKAFELNTRLAAASNNLTVCLFALGRTEEANKYFRISLANGADEEALREAIKLYTKEIE